jgi:hypothetical protein
LSVSERNYPAKTYFEEGSFRNPWARLLDMVKRQNSDGNREFWFLHENILGCSETKSENTLVSMP